MGALSKGDLPCAALSSVLCLTPAILFPASWSLVLNQLFYSLLKKSHELDCECGLRVRGGWVSQRAGINTWSQGERQG